MTARNRSKNNSNSNSSSDRGVASQQPDDAPRKSTSKVAAKAEENAPLASRGSGSDASMLMKCVCTLFYLALAAGVVFASVHFQRELSEIRHASVRNEESAMKCAAAAREVENAFTQVSGLHHPVAFLLWKQHTHSANKICSKSDWIAINLTKTLFFK